MKRLVLISVAVLMLIPALALAGGSSSTCNTKYPVVLAHGAGVSAKVFGIIDAWWGIEDALEDEGARVYITSVNGMDGTTAKAANWKRQVLQILAVSGSSKINVIGHSHGTIYTRYAISNLGLSGKVKSYTSLCGPHRGSSIANILVYNLPSNLLSLVGGMIDQVYAIIFGDSNPNTVQMGYDLCTDYMKNVFNPATPNMTGIYYQSWAAKAKWGCPSVYMTPTWLVLLPLEGDNDGLVSVSSAKWGNFRGVVSGAWYSPGVDHINMVGHFFGLTPGFDAPDFYVDIVSDLKNRGY
ncbi:MAG: alpha/beta fold hydrolase [Thermodesulfobacteriota bacterium]